MLLCNGGIVTALFFVLLLNHNSVRRSRANTFLSILLVALAFSIFHILHAGSVIRHFSADVYSPGDPTFLLIAPLSWMYAATLTGRNVYVRFKWAIHFIPFLLIILFSLTVGAGQTGKGFIHDHKKILYIIFWAMVVLQFAGYQYDIQKKWMKHRQLIQQEVSNIENVNVSWVQFYLIVLLLISLFFLVSLFTAIHWEHIRLLSKATALVFSLSVFALCFMGILQRDIFDTIKKDKLPELSVADQAPPPVQLTKPDQPLIDKLVGYMTAKKPYLNPELSLNTLAKELKISRGQLSQLINDGLGENFYDFINKYRVEEVKKLMADPEMAHFNLLGLAFEAGFKSKSTFNLIFKRFTGLTPTEYRKNINA
jgi:AraC-like DNA-binding protein